MTVSRIETSLNSRTKATFKPTIYRFRSFRSPRLLVSQTVNLSSSQKNILEIGSGSGLYAIELAKKNPSATVVGIEKTKNKFNLFKGRLSNHPHLKNLHAIHADARFWITQNVPDESIEQVFILYPNPLPMRKQANLRWHHSPFVDKLLKTLKVGAQLHIATNVEGYFHEAKSILTKVLGMSLQLERSTHASSWPARTHFEIKYMARGDACFDAVFRKGE